jgi:hypothetical protein
MNVVLAPNSRPKYGSTWISLLALGLPMAVCGNALVYVGATSRSVDVGGLIDGFVFLFGLGAVGVGLWLTIWGLLLRLRPPPATR